MTNDAIGRYFALLKCPLRLLCFFVQKLLVFVGIEYAFNVFPATPVSSAVLQVCHFTLLLALLVTPLAPDVANSIAGETSVVEGKSVEAALRGVKNKRSKKDD